MTYVRLANLATERSDLDAAAKYRSKAEALCPKLEWRRCSADEIASVVQRVDDHSIWNPKKTSTDHGS